MSTAGCGDKKCTDFAKPSLYERIQVAHGTTMVSPNPSPSTAGTVAATGAPRSLQDVVIRLAGNSQDGIQSIGGFLARLAGRSDQEVMTYMTIPSTISGGPSIFQVRMGSGEILSAGDRADVLVAFYQHSYHDHRASLRPGGVLLYDSDHVTPNPEDREVDPPPLPCRSMLASDGKTSPVNRLLQSSHVGCALARNVACTCRP